MKIAEIRIKKGLTQAEAAKVLGISRRTYQYLESDDTDTSSFKYVNYCDVLDSFENTKAISFNTSVIYGRDLLQLINKVKNYKKRYCYSYLLDYLKNDYSGKVCILYGLRRTGKTTLLFQSLMDLDLTSTAYIKVNETNSMGDLIKDINFLKNNGFKAVLIDEITLIDDFINTAATLSDIYSTIGMKIVLSGTDSLGFAFSDKDELFDRNIMIHTSYISFKEYSEVLGINDIDEYIEYGGTLKMENMDFNDPDYNKEEVAFKDDESTRKYIDTAISKNIQRTLKNKSFGDMFVNLRELYESNELTNIINRLVENMNHEFLLSVILDKFKSHDLGSSRQLLTHDKDETIQTALYDIDTEAVTNRLKEILEIKEKDDLTKNVDGLVIGQIKNYLYALDLIRDVEVRYEDGSLVKRVVFIQPGMRYSITKALVHSLMLDSYFASLDYSTKEYITQKILSDVKGRMLEEIVLLETSNRKQKGYLNFKYFFMQGGEYDLVSFNVFEKTLDLYEIKHSKEITFDNQIKYLISDNMNNKIQEQFGKINGRYVLYRGEDQTIGNVQYLNVEKYLLK